MANPSSSLWVGLAVWSIPRLSYLTFGSSPLTDWEEIHRSRPVVYFRKRSPSVNYCVPLLNKFVPLGNEHAELTARLKALAERAGTKVSGVFRFDMSKRTKAANAALTGLGNTRRIILGDTLLNEFTTDEVETVIAHELGHHVHRDIPLFLAFGSVVGLLGLYLASLVLTWEISVFGFVGPADIAALPLLVIAMGVFSLVLTPLNNALSRWRERLADRYALESTHKPQAFADAMTRLANQNLAEADPEPWVVFFFYSHPPIRERVAAAHAFKG